MDERGRRTGKGKSIDTDTSVLFITFGTVLVLLSRFTFAIPGCNVEFPNIVWDGFGQRIEVIVFICDGVVGNTVRLDPGLCMLPRTTTTISRYTRTGNASSVGMDSSRCRTHLVECPVVNSNT